MKNIDWLKNVNKIEFHVTTVPSTWLLWGLFFFAGIFFQVRWGLPPPTDAIPPDVFCM